MPNHDEYIHRILTAIESGRPITQRALSQDMGVALGLMNLLIRRLVNKGYVKIGGLQRNRMRYLLTPAGIVEKTRVSRAYFANTLRLYTETRERIRASLETVSTGWVRDEPGARAQAPKRIVFYGAGEVAEIGFVSLQSTDLRLVGVVDDFVSRPFFGLSVESPDGLREAALAEGRFDRVVIMSFRKADAIQERLDRLEFPRSRVHRLL